METLNIKTLILGVTDVNKIITVKSFLADKQGCKFKAVVEDNKVKFNKLLRFFNDEARQKRLEYAELHFDQPALAGVIKELESLKWFGCFFSENAGQDTYRTRQAIGTIVRIIMESRGWEKTGRKGSLGQRAKVQSGDRTPGVHHNVSGISKWFTRAERYINIRLYKELFGQGKIL